MWLTTILAIAGSHLTLHGAAFVVETKKMRCVAPSLCAHPSSAGAERDRRSLFSSAALAVVGAAAARVPQASAAAVTATTTSESGVFFRSGDGYGYKLAPPRDFAPSNKPLKTHLDEIEFVPTPSVRGYKYGVTVDPVRIDSIRRFGTPDEVAARVVGAEIARDGVTDVTLARDATEDPNDGTYTIEYVSTGSRGVKHFVARIGIRDRRLYVLTAQVAEDDFRSREKELFETVSTFRIDSS